jgi:sugar/nucleoside kinase (ribokinase family)
MKLDAYVYGMTVFSTIHRLAGKFPALDTYGEIAGTWKVPGGEAMNAAMVLSRLGLRCKIGGPRLGSESAPVVKAYTRRYGIDASGLSMEKGWPGVKDMILVDDDHRTVFGSFGAYFSDKHKRWDAPDPKACRGAGIVCVDPFFGQESETAARLCADAGTPYVTIDCPPSGALSVKAAATVVSREYRKQQFPGIGDDELLRRYSERGAGLIVFTSGSDRILYRRGLGKTGELMPFAVQAASTLGAGDVFRAGIAYGLYKGQDDDTAVRFAAALAAVACTRVPIADSPPALDEVERLLRGGKA